MNSLAPQPLRTTAADREALRGPGRMLTELSILIRIQFSIVRDSWVWVLIMATLFPLTTLLFMRFFISSPDPGTIARIISGNMIFGVIVMGLNGLGQEISWQKHQGHFTFYAALPISKVNFVLANLLRGIMNTLPSFLIMALIGHLIYGIRFNLSWELPLVFILSLTSIVGVGVSIGFWSPNHQLTNILTQVAMMLISFLTPVMVEMNQLPLPIQWISYGLPTTYAADALRHVLLEGWTEGVAWDCAFMLGFTLLTYVIITRTVSWRESK